MVDRVLEPFARLLPYAGDVSPRRRRAAAAAAGVLLLSLAVHLGYTVLGIGVAAEGVEDEATLRRLTDYGAMVAQGYHIARPMPAADLEAWLAAGAFVLRLVDHEDVERARPVDAFHAVELDVRSGGRA